MDQKNFIVAIVLSVVIIMGWQTLFPAKPTPPPAADQPDRERRTRRARRAQPSAPGAPGSAPATTPPRSRS